MFLDDQTSSTAVIDEDRFAVDDELLEIFHAEAEELLARIGENLSLLERDPAHREPFWEIRRSAHTFKGAAGLAGQTAASKTAHRIEDLFDKLSEHTAIPDNKTLGIIRRGADILSQRINEEHGPTLDKKTEQLYADIDEQLGSLSAQKGRRAQTVEVVNATPPQSAPGANSKKVSRVSLERIDELACIGQELTDLQNDFDLALRKFTEDPAIASHVENFRRLTQTLREKTLRVRMIAFGTLVPRLNRAVYVTAEEEGKRAELIVENGQVELDTEVLDFLAEPLLHLLKNAVVHGIEKPETRELLDKPETGRVKIAVDSDDAYVILTITDDGSGISVEKLRSKAMASNILLENIASEMSDDDIRQFIFIPGLSTAGELNMNAGRGIGMSIVKESVESRGGMITVNSVPGKGAEFTICIPHASPFSHIIKTAGSIETQSNFDVLVVDDSRTIRERTAQTIKSIGWKVAAAENGKEALEILKNAANMPFIILTDLEMPEIDGFELLAALKSDKSFSAIPVVMITSRTDEHCSTRAFELGAAAYLTKPVVDLHLVDVVRDLLPPATADGNLQCQYHLRKRVGLT